MSTDSQAPPSSVLGVRERWRPAVEPFLEPGERLQVIVPARGGLARSTLGMIQTLLPFTRQGQYCLLVATDRAWLPLIRPKRTDDPMTPQPRCARSVRLSLSAIHRIDGLDQPYAIDPMWADHVRAANEALEATQAGRAWDLAECGEWVRRDKKDGGGTPLTSILRRSR